MAEFPDIFFSLADDMEVAVPAQGYPEGYNLEFAYYPTYLNSYYSNGTNQNTSAVPRTVPRHGQYLENSGSNPGAQFLDGRNHAGTLYSPNVRSTQFPNFSDWQPQPWAMFNAPHQGIDQSRGQLDLPAPVEPTNTDSTGSAYGSTYSTYTPTESSGTQLFSNPSPRLDPQYCYTDANPGDCGPNQTQFSSEDTVMFAQPFSGPSTAFQDAHYNPTNNGVSGQLMDHEAEPSVTVSYPGFSELDSWNTPAPTNPQISFNSAEPNFRNIVSTRTFLPIPAVPFVDLESRLEIVEYVKQNLRKQGPACGLCSEQRVKCETEGEEQFCLSCLKRGSFDPIIALRICKDYNELARDARKPFKDFFNVGPESSRQRLISRWENSRNSKRRTLSFSYPPINSNGFVYTSDTRLRLEVEGAMDLTIDEERRSKLNVPVVPLPPDETFQSSVYESIPPQLTYLIIPSSLPSRETLLNWGIQRLDWRASILPNDLESSLHMLLISYVRHKPPLLLHDLVSNTLSAAILSHVFLMSDAAVEVLKDDRHVQTHHYACRTLGYHQHMRPFVEMSHPARNQLFIHAARAYEVFEKRVLAKIDHLVFDKKKGRVWVPACSDPLILGLCIRSLSLQYRSYMLKYKYLGCRPSSRYERGRTMYDTMIRHYRHVFRGTLSPFHEDWKLEEHREALGFDQDLIMKFEQVKIAEEMHCKNELNSDDDALYLRIFLHQQSRNGYSPAKAWGIS